MPFNSDLIRGSTETIVLHLLHERRMYGYEIIKLVNERTDNAFEWKEGTLYPCLHRLEGAGVIASEWVEAENGKHRKYYHLTHKGRAFCRERVAEWNAFSTAMSALLMQPAS